MPAALSFVTNASRRRPNVLWMELPAVPGKPDRLRYTPSRRPCPPGPRRSRTFVNAAAAQIGRIDEGRAGGIELRDKRIVAAAECALDGICLRCREIPATW